MDDQHEPSPEQPPVHPRRRGRAAATVVSVVALVVVGSGAGYAVAQRHVADTATTGVQQQTSSEQLPGAPGDGWRQGPGAGQSGASTDTTSRASGRQLTGLVRIVSTLSYEDGKAAGTGLVLTSGGEVVTNHHVVAGATSIAVTVMTTGQTYTARVVGSDTDDDVAVLQLVGASGLQTVTVDHDAVSVGDAVTAVGDGRGTVDHLGAATGSVLATGQSIMTQSEGSAAGERLGDLIEISSDVVGGYSGGATYDSEGEVLGMTTAASSGSRDIVGYAIPIATVTRIAADLESGTRSSRYTYGSPAFLGVGLGSAGTTVAQVYDDTPAATAGIVAGDRLTSVGSTLTSTATALRAAIAAHRPGDRVRIGWTDSSGARHSATVTLTTGPVS